MLKRYHGRAGGYPIVTGTSYVLRLVGDGIDGVYDRVEYKSFHGQRYRHHHFPKRLLGVPP